MGLERLPNHSFLRLYTFKAWIKNLNLKHPNTGKLGKYFEEERKSLRKPQSANKNIKINT